MQVRITGPMIFKLATHDEGLHPAREVSIALHFNGLEKGQIAFSGKSGGWHQEDCEGKQEQWISNNRMILH